MSLEIGDTVSLLLKGILQRVVDQSTASTNRELDKIVADLKALDKLIEGPNFGEGLEWWPWPKIKMVLDEVDYLIDEMQITSSKNQPSHLMPKKVRFNPFSQQSKKVKTIRRRLDVIVQDATNWLLDPPIRRIHRHKDVSHRKTDSIVNFEDIFGRERDKAAIMDLIWNSGAEPSDRVSIVPIVGFIGVGKTTLAQLIYNEVTIQVNFHQSFWVSLEYKSHDNVDVVREILRNYSHHFHLDEPIHDDRAREEEELKREVQRLICGKRFFIVLDGFEDINKSVVPLLQDMGSKSKNGSVILVTTRSRRAASLIGTTLPYKLDPLSEDASYQLLIRHLGADSQDHQAWDPIARDVVKYCSGVPLFLVIYSSVLRHHEPERVARRKNLVNLFSDSIYRDSGFYPALMPACLRHMQLPLESFRLQKACGLGEEALTCVWMALGCLYSDDPTQPPESIARKYLLEIAESPLCPDVEYAPGGIVRHIKFNEALLEFATSNGGAPWGFMSPRHHIFDENTRYIIWDEDDLSAASTLYSRGQVRLFILCIRNQTSAGLVNDIIAGYKFLRVLGFGGCNIEMLPDSIGELKHLRYLDVGRNARMKRLPASICDLWHLQTLFLHGCSLEEVPADIGRLQNLRYLTLTILKESLPEEVGQLISLRTLALANCPMLAYLPSTLKNLTNLQTLGIVGCQDLDLTANSSAEGLKGLDAINTLLLSYLPKFLGLPTDLGNPGIAMKHLMIQSCRNMIETTWIMQFRFLRSLTIEDCPQLLALTSTDVISQLDGVLELVIRRCPRLGSTEWIGELKSLRSIIIDDCPMLVELDAAFSELKNLERLEIRRCPGLSEWFASSAGKDWLPSIHHVRVIELDGVHLKYSYLPLI